MDEKLCKKLRLDKFKDIAYIGKSKEESHFNSMGYAENLTETTDLAIFYVYFSRRNEEGDRFYERTIF